MLRIPRWMVCIGSLSCFASLVACGGATAALVTDDDGGGGNGDAGAAADDGGSTVITGPDSSTAHDGGSTPSNDASTTRDASPPPPPPPPDPTDGTPMRQQCTGNFGNALSTSHGRLDGFLVSIVNVGGSHTCNGDSTHVHLQVLMGGAIYDVAVNTDTLLAQRDIALPDGAWTEGWHTSDALDYASLGLHSGDFTMPSSQNALAQQIESEVANANHISIFATGYGPTGAHLVHRNGSGHDGAIVVDPLSPTAHVMMFTFTTSTPF